MNGFYDVFYKAKTESIKIFKQTVLDRLEVFNDFHVEWEKKSGFPFLGLTSKEYYLQKDFEKIIEHNVRYILINNVLKTLLKFAGVKSIFLEQYSEALKPDIKTNKDYENERGFEFIVDEDEKRIGFRYTFLPVFSELDYFLQKQIDNENISEIIIIDWSLRDQPEEPQKECNYRFANLVIKYLSVYEFFALYIDESIYKPFIEYVQSAVTELQEYLGVISIPRLTPALLFRFRFYVEQLIIEHMSKLESFRNTFRTASNDIYKNLAYQVLDDETKQDEHYKNLEERSLAFLFNTTALKRYRSHKLYRALIGRSSFARCLLTSEYLYRNYNKSDEFDFTSIASGYLKSVEQLMYAISLCFIDKRRHDGEFYQIAPRYGEKKRTKDYTTQNLNEGAIDTSIGALCHFFKDNKSLLLVNGTYKETLINCLFCYAEECRNDNFHKHNIDEWSRLEAIRSNTFFIYILLLGSCAVDVNGSEFQSHIAIAKDDRLSRIYYQLMNSKELVVDFYIHFAGREPIEVWRPRERDYPLFDNYGILQNKSLELEIQHLSDEQKTLPQTITITDEHLPDEIWYEDENDWMVKHFLEY